MEKVGAYEAKTHLSKLLDRVRRGECFMITKNGIDVAVLQPPEAGKRIDPHEIIRELRKFREKHTLDGLSIREMIQEGRR